MTYANAVLPHALFDAAHQWPDAEFLAIAESSFEFLDHATTADRIFCPVGNHDWFSHGQEKSPYDQQPVEASTMAAAALAAFELRGDPKYLNAYSRAHSWFLGMNSLDSPLADVGSGACYDGLQPAGVNKNQGAESTLAWLWTEMHRFAVQQPRRDPAKTVIANR